MPAEKRTAARRERIIEAAFELLDDGGLTTTSVRAVCRTAGLTSRYFYESFDSIEHLLATVFTELEEQLFSAVHAALGDAPELLDGRVRAIVESAAAVAFEDPRRVRVLLTRATDVDLPADHMDVSRRIAAVIGAEATEAGHAWDAATNRFVAGGLAEVMLAWTQGELAAPEDELIDAVTELVLRQAIAVPATSTSA